VTEAIIVALITAASAVVCQIVIASNSRKTMQQAQYDSQKTIQQAQYDSQKLIEYKIDKLSERVDKHNSVIARTYKLEQDYALIDEKIKVANHRIDDLERK
jgi:peptidoglycan hydrolase CwlO-like protein